MSHASFALAPETLEGPGTRTPRPAFRGRRERQSAAREAGRPEGTAHDRMVARALAIFPGSILLEG